jgi:uncharacterized protein (DUF342 family)
MPRTKATKASAAKRPDSLLAQHSASLPLLIAVNNFVVISTEGYEVASTILDCTVKAVKERIRRFTAPNDPTKVTESQMELLVAVFTASEVSSVDCTQVAIELGITEKAVKGRTSRLSKKLGLDEKAVTTTSVTKPAPKKTLAEEEDIGEAVNESPPLRKILRGRKPLPEPAKKTQVCNFQCSRFILVGPIH